MYQLTPAHNAVVEEPVPSKIGWRYDAKAKINGGIALAGDLLIFDTFDRQVVALEAATGKPRWVSSSDNVIMSTPVISNGLIVVGTGRNAGHNHDGGFVYESGNMADATDIWGRPEGDHIIALRASDGSVAWSYRTAGENMPSPAIVGNNVIFANGDSHAYALRLSSGDPAWRIDTDGLSTMASATAANGRVMLSVCNFMQATAHTYAVAPASGEVIWEVPFGNCDSSPTVGAGAVYLSGISGNQDAVGFGGRAVIAAVDEKTGSLRWRYESPSNGAYTSVGSSERAIAGMFDSGVYYQALPTEDAFVAFNAQTGKELWRVRTAAPVKMSAVVRKGRIYFGDTAGLLYTVSANGGKVISERPFDEPFTTAPPVALGSSLLLVNGENVRRLAI